MKGLIGLIRFFINLSILFLLLYGLEGYISNIQTNIGDNINNPKALIALVGNLSNQMLFLFAAGVVVAIIVYLLHTTFMNYLTKYLNKLI